MTDNGSTTQNPGPMSPIYNESRRNRPRSSDKTISSTSITSTDTESHHIPKQPESKLSTITSEEMSHSDVWRHRSFDPFGTLRRPLNDPSPPPPPLLTFPIESGHPLIPLWQPIRKEILETLRLSPLSWSALEVLRRRRTMEPRDEEDTTVVVTARNVDELAWDTLKIAIKNICRRHNQSHLKVELIDGVVSRGVTLSFPYRQEPSNGSSVGVSGLKWASGSFGGYFELVDEDGNVFNCALSCHHVLRPTKKPLRSSTSSEPAELKPDPVKSTPGKQMWVQQQ